MGFDSRTIASLLALATAGLTVFACSTTPSTMPGTMAGASTHPATGPAASRPGGIPPFGRGGRGGRGGAGGQGTRRMDLPFQNPALTLDERLDDLLPRLTVDEKVGQMQMAAPAIDRLGIPAYHWWNEALHGVARNGEATVFPQAIGMAATWNTDLHYQMARVIAVEGRAKHEEALKAGIHAIYTGLDMWSPNINIFRDPRWGRGQETYGEDPYLTGRFGVAFVTGLQGDDPFYFKTIATPKHYAVHSGPEPERHRFDVEPAETDLWTTYLPAFEATIREGHAFSVMSAYNRVDGLPASANPRLLTEILRKQWGFEGYVTSDVDAVRDVYQNHQTAGTPEEAAAMSVKAGCDLNGGTTYQALSGAVKLGLITEAELDVSLRRLFAARIRFGEFDSPPAPGAPDPNPYSKIPPSANDTRENDAVSLQVARQSMVLLKNANKTLPLKKEIRSIAVIGPTADSTVALLGNYNGTPSHPVTILQGIRNAVPLSTHVLYSAGSPLVTEEIPLAEPISKACLFTDATRKVHGLYGTYSRNYASSDRTLRTRIDASIDLAFPEQAVRDSIAYADGFYTKWTGVLVPPETGDYQVGFAGKDAYRLYLDDQLVVDEWYLSAKRSAGNAIHLEKNKSYTLKVEYYHPPYTRGGGNAGGGGGGGAGAATQAATQPGTQPATQPAAPVVPAAPAAAAPTRDDASIQLRWTRPTADGKAAGVDGLPLFASATRAAEQADATVLVLGLTAELEREEHEIHYAGFADGDRTSIDLPAVQEQLLEEVTAAAKGKPVILVLTSGSALSVNWANEHVPAILEAWYPGQHGEAVADVLFGNVNPGGRLPVTFYKSIKDLPDFSDYSMALRTYRYAFNEPLYPFGHGLSYSTFTYNNLKISPKDPTTTDSITAAVTVKNTSAVEGDEVVQLYLDRPATPESLRYNVGLDGRIVDTGNESLVSLANRGIPRKTLAGFKRITLKPNEEKTVEFTVTPHQLGLVDGSDKSGKRVVMPAPVTIRIGPSSVGGLSQEVALHGERSTPEYKFVEPKVD